MSLLSNAKWNSFSQFFKVIVQVINIVYLAKLIPPSEYGVMAIALVFVNLANLLRDLGTSASLIQRRTLSHSLINSVFWFNVLMGIVLAIIIAIISPLVAGFYEQGKLINILCLLSITFPLASCATVHLSLLERESKFRVISLIEIISASASVIVAIIMANEGYGVYSLVMQSLIINASSAIMFWRVSGWKPTLKGFINWSEIKDIFHFSSRLAGFNFVNYFSRNMDSFIIGKFMSTVILGNYNLAYRIMLFPVQSLTFVMSRSLYPILSSSQDDNELIKCNYLKCVVYILSISAPLMTGLAFFSNDFVRVVFGDNWSLTGNILHWLAPTAIIQSILSTTGAVFTAKGRTDILFRLGILGALLQVTAFIIGVKFNILVFSALYLLANIINFFPVMYTLLKLIDCPFSVFLKEIFIIIPSTLIMLCFLFFYGEGVSISTSVLINIILQSLIGAVVYFLALFFLVKVKRVFV